jgi:5-methylcytosine-specific restriction endonuclease McrA
MNIDKFKTFLKISGAELQKTTNEYELVRFRTINGVSVVYKGKRGYSFTGEAQEAFDAMRKSTVWTIMPRGLKEKKQTQKALLKRDGTRCFYCNVITTVETRTIEHLLSVSNGGNNNLANLVISCKSCNQAVGDIPILEKIAYRDAFNKS